VKLLYQGALWQGGTALQRCEAFRSLPGVYTIALDTGARIGTKQSLYNRVLWKLRWPVDEREENEGVLRTAAVERPDVVFLDNSRVIRRATLWELRDLGVRCLVYYTPDDIIGRHNLSRPLRRTFAEWDIFFTTKSFNVRELSARGVRNPILIGKAYDQRLHRPYSREEVGADYERFDAVFMGSYEKQRSASINALAEAGVNTLVYGGRVGGWDEKAMHKAAVVREARFADDYAIGMHHGKVALCFLRKLNRDRIISGRWRLPRWGGRCLPKKRKSTTRISSTARSMSVLRRTPNWSRRRKRSWRIPRADSKSATRR
jgi:spore maturation protein CgeB